MPDEEEFAGPLAAQMAGQMAMRGYCSTVAGEWGVSSLIRTPRHVAISQSPQHPKRHGQPVLVQR